MRETTELTKDAMAARLKAAALELADANESREVALERRNELIRQAVDEVKMTTLEVAKHADLSQPSVMRVLGTEPKT